MTFDIIVFEEDELPDGNLGLKQHPENGVHASSRKELIALYAMSGQKIKILREYGGEKPASPINTPISNVVSSQVNAAPIQTTEQSMSTTVDVQQPKYVVNQDLYAAQKTTSMQQKCTVPQYYKIGDVEIKIENGVSYQKQFMRLTDTEASNIRVVDDKTNRTVNLKGKHIEMKRWVKVETNQTDDLAALEENLS